MLDSVLRVFGEEFEVESFLKAHALSVPVETYKKGEEDILGNANVESGFDAFISENIDITEQLKDVRLFLEVNAALLNVLKNIEVDCVIDIGCTVGEEQSSPSIRIPADLLGLCHELNVAIEVSLYASFAE